MAAPSAGMTSHRAHRRGSRCQPSPHQVVAAPRLRFPWPRPSPSLRGTGAALVTVVGSTVVSSAVARLLTCCRSGRLTSSGTSGRHLRSSSASEPWSSHCTGAQARWRCRCCHPSTAWPRPGRVSVASWASWCASWTSTGPRRRRRLRGGRKVPVEERSPSSHGWAAAASPPLAGAHPATILGAAAHLTEAAAPSGAGVPPLEEGARKVTLLVARLPEPTVARQGPSGSGVARTMVAGTTDPLCGSASMAAHRHRPACRCSLAGRGGMARPVPQARPLTGPASRSSAGTWCLTPR